MFWYLVRLSTGALNGGHGLESGPSVSHLTTFDQPVHQKLACIQPTVGLQTMRKRIARPSLGTNNYNPYPSSLTSKPTPISTNQPSSETWADHFLQFSDRPLQPASTPELNWLRVLGTPRLRRSRIAGPSHPPGAFPLAATEIPVMAAKGDIHQQVVGNAARGDNLPTNRGERRKRRQPTNKPWGTPQEETTYQQTVGNDGGPAL